MENTTKTVCRQLADLLVAHGVDMVFSSPGSRNAPLIVAFANKKELRLIPVTDERVAAFMALGYASISGKPVAIVCTSGTALLNYMPAIAEAFYRKIPMIVISADRPIEWIDQDDSQTIRQAGALDNFVKKSYDISDCEAKGDIWYANRLINDALLSALEGRKAPVHINVKLHEPLGSLSDIAPRGCRVIDVVKSREDLIVAEARSLAKLIASPRKVMIVAGFNSPDNRLNKALNKIAAFPNVIVLTETISNLHGDDFIGNIDSVLSTMDEELKIQMQPDVVISLGGALISRFIKNYLRNYSPAEHWHVGVTHTTIDCFCSLTRRIDLDPGIFFQQLASGLQPHREQSSYKKEWLELRQSAKESHDAYVGTAEWSDLKAFAILDRLMPAQCNLQVSNGTPIRYMQLVATKRFHRSDCNRGVSGIDGGTSTAVGAAIAAPNRKTVLISGDMGAQYDLGALTYAGLVPNLRIIVMMNGGGSIFRFIQSTSELPQTEEYLAIDRHFPIGKLAEAYNLDYFEAYDERQLKEVFPRFVSEAGNKAAVLAIYTPKESNAQILKEYFKRTNR